MEVKTAWPFCHRRLASPDSCALSPSTGSGAGRANAAAAPRRGGGLSLRRAAACEHAVARVAAYHALGQCARHLHVKPRAHAHPRPLVPQPAQVLAPGGSGRSADAATRQLGHVQAVLRLDLLLFLALYHPLLAAPPARPLLHRRLLGVRAALRRAALKAERGQGCAACARCAAALARAHPHRRRAHAATCLCCTMRPPLSRSAATSWVDGKSCSRSSRERSSWSPSPVRARLSRRAFHAALDAVRRRALRAVTRWPVANALSHLHAATSVRAASVQARSRRWCGCSSSHRSSHCRTRSRTRSPSSTRSTSSSSKAHTWASRGPCTPAWADARHGGCEARRLAWPVAAGGCEYDRNHESRTGIPHARSFLSRSRG